MYYLEIDDSINFLFLLLERVLLEKGYPPENRMFFYGIGHPGVGSVRSASSS